MTGAVGNPQTPKTIALKDPILAALLAWLIPGLGHVYQGRVAKGLLFFVCLMGTFVYGCYLGSGDKEKVGIARVVYLAWTEEDMRLPFFCQLGIGLPAMPALVQAHRASNGNPPLSHGFMAPPRPVPPPGTARPSEKVMSALENQPSLDELNYHLRGFFELGTVFTMIAGLLNILAIYDAWGGPVFSEEKSKDDEDES